MTENTNPEENIIDLTSEQPAEATEQESTDEAKPEVETKEQYLPLGQNISSILPIAILPGKVTGEENNRVLTVALPSALPDYIDSVLSAAPNTELGTNEHNQLWASVINGGMENTPMHAIGLSALEDPKASWGQGVEHPSKTMLSATDPKTKTATGQVLEGEQAQLQFLRYAGLGSLFTVPLWHTGIWITLKCPSDTELMDVHRALANDKIELGRSSFGLSLSAATAHTSELLVALALRNVYMSSIKVGNTSELQDIISSQDVPAIIWALACVVWNSGFDFQRGCTHDPEKCNHIHKERIDLSKLYWVNKNALTDKQIAHMYKRQSGSMSKDEVAAYQAEFSASRTTRLTFRENDAPFHFELQVPTIRKYFENANTWIYATVAAVEHAVTATDDEQERRQMVLENARVTVMRGYGHWVKSIIFNENVMQNEKDISGLLDRLSAELEIATAFENGVKQLINETLISLVAIPDYECPSCHKKQMHKDETEANPLKALVPIDPINTFFSLLVHRLTTFLR